MRFFPAGHIVRCSEELHTVFFLVNRYDYKYGMSILLDMSFNMWLSKEGYPHEMFSKESSAGHFGRCSQVLYPVLFMSVVMVISLELSPDMIRKGTSLRVDFCP